MHTSKTNPRRRPRFLPAPETLESREVMTAGAGNTIAILPGLVAQPGGVAPVAFHLDPQSFTMPRNRVALGVDIAAPNGSTLDPVLSPVGLPRGATVQARSIAGTDAAMIATLGGRGRRGPAGPLDFTATATGRNQTAGNFLVGFYLPGDANGDGTVDKTDIKSIRQLIGSTAGDQTYQFDADSNRDGRINFQDMRLAQQNLGVKTTLTPLVSSNLDPASDTGAADRVTSLNTAHFTGTASGGATITYSEIHQRVGDVTTVASPEGQYSITVPLAEGSNQFKVTVKDSSGQVISGTINGVYSVAALAQLDTSKSG